LCVVVLSTGHLFPVGPRASPRCPPYQGQHLQSSPPLRVFGQVTLRSKISWHFALHNGAFFLPSPGFFLPPPIYVSNPGGLFPPVPVCRSFVLSWVPNRSCSYFLFPPPFRVFLSDYPYVFNPSPFWLCWSVSGLFKSHLEYPPRFGPPLSFGGRSGVIAQNHGSFFQVLLPSFAEYFNGKVFFIPGWPPGSFRSPLS